MTWVEPTSTVLSAGALAYKLAESSSFIRKHWARMIYRIRHGSALIPIFGAGGVGKSTVSRILAGSDPLDITAPYEESWVIEPVELQGNVPGQLLVGPGQIQRADRHWPELFRNIVTGTSFGVINVVSYGYHSFAIRSYKEHDEFEVGMNESAFMSKYIEARRVIELEMLRRVLDGLSATDKPLWLVTLVSKQDLWWEQRQRVRDHYENGPYSEIVKSFAASLGERIFQHEILPVSLAIGNLTTPAGEVLAPTTGGYDTALHLSSLQSMFSRLHGLIAQGAP